MKQFSSKRSVQILGHVLQQYGISEFVISPGSRNAPLAVHFSALEGVKCYSIVDERSAAFVGLGMAKSLKKPVALSCTSGSAVVNYYPAIVEAFYSNVPLLILTADRPRRFLDIFDGQMIHQSHVFQPHTYGSFDLLEEDTPNADEYNLGNIKEAVELCIQRQGPVHINIPLDEPLYEYVSEIPNFGAGAIDKTVNEKEEDYEIPIHFAAEWNSSKKILILIGTMDKNPELESMLSYLVKNHSAVVLTEINSNLHHDNFFPHIDRYLFGFDERDYQDFTPDLLITIGQNVVSKKIKEFLRKSDIEKHWHIDTHWHPDTYFALTEKIKVIPEVFFLKLIPHILLAPRAYYNLWERRKRELELKHREYTNSVEFSDFKVYDILRSYIPDGYNVHFSNSSVIRYAQLFDFKTTNKFYCNRGANGIDGSTSTAMGFAMMSQTPTLLITGDLSFFYDINGLWNQYIPPYTRIILINNGEGNIFRIIPGPDSTNVVDELIATKHHRNAEALSKNFGFSYFRVEEQESLERSLLRFFLPEEKPKILEVDTSKINNERFLREYFNEIGK